MIQSMESCFYGEEYEIRRYRNTNHSADRLSISKESEVKYRLKKDSTSGSLKEKRRIGNLTTKWLKQNYCASPDVCLPREIVYEQYLEFCRKEGFSPACKATFGKLIRNTFPKVTSKRLGARGHSKYHYNGIGIKQTSEFRNANPTFHGITRFSGSTNNNGTNPKKFCLSSKVGTLLPNFPSVEDLVIPIPEDKAKLATFLLMYKTHSQCILHVVISGSFEEVRVFLLHFWQGFPDHLMSLTSLDIFLDLVAICDCILYRTLLDVIVPSLSFEMSEKLLQNIHNIGIHWNVWVQNSLENMPQKLIDRKMALAKRFGRSLKRYVAFLHLSQVTRPVLASDAAVFLSKELEFVLHQVAIYSWSSNSEFGDENEQNVTLEHARQLRNILSNCNSVELLIDTLDKMLLGVKGWKEENKAETRNFVFNWVYMLSKASYILTESQSEVFTTFHLLSSLIQEYILLAFESQLDKEHEEHMYGLFKKHLKHSGNITSSTSFHSSTSSYSMNQTNKPDTTYLANEKPKRVLERLEHSESHAVNGCCIYNNGNYPSTCIYCPRTTTSPQVRPSCKYATNACHNSTPYDYQPWSSPLVVEDNYQYFTPQPFLYH